MNTIDMLNTLARFASLYSPCAVESVKINSHMNGLKETLTQEAVDALLVDFISHIAIKHGIDYAMYTKDLYGFASKIQFEKRPGDPTHKINLAAPPEIW